MKHRTVALAVATSLVLAGGLFFAGQSGPPIQLEVLEPLPPISTTTTTTTTTAPITTTTQLEIPPLRSPTTTVAPHTHVAVAPHTHVRTQRDITGVEQWRSLVGEYFLPEHVDAALSIIQCESRGNPDAKNPISTASGLFQILRGWWSGNWSIDPFDPFDPRSNVSAASIIADKGNSWTDWTCKP